MIFSVEAPKMVGFRLQACRGRLWGSLKKHPHHRRPVILHQQVAFDINMSYFLTEASSLRFTKAWVNSHLPIYSHLLSHPPEITRTG